jgi:iron(III) transport system substrate-binding protein
MKRTARLAAGLVTIALVAAACGGDDDSAGTVVVYTGRHYGIEPVFESFTDATGIEVEFTTGNDAELRERLAAEGANTPADVLMTADASNAEIAAAAGLLAPFASQAIRDTIPVELRSDDDLWTALTRRARSVIYSTERVTEPPTSYAEVGEPQWSGRVCLRPSTHPYTQSLVAGLIAANGEEGAREIVDAWVANDPLYINSDTDIYQAVADGECDIAIANSYYLGRILAEDADFPVALAWVEQPQPGTHINVSAAGITAEAPHPENAEIFLEWMATTGQAELAGANSEYPADPDAELSDVVASWGEFVGDVAAVKQLGELQPAAVSLLSAAGYE